ncbi:MAG: hypothetical protein DRI99_02430, partial [Candidatus Aminicenantes bacterium]
MKVGRYCLLFILTLTFLFPLMAKDVVVQSQWTSQPVNIDGNSQDWAPEILNKWNKFKVDYGFMNDGNN